MGAANIGKFSMSFVERRPRQSIRPQQNRGDLFRAGLQVRRALLRQSGTK
jgi:hypothetical protein